CGRGGRRAEQRLDVTATHPNGSVQRLLVECKDWNKEVGKGTLDALVGVRDQAGFDAAMVLTTKGSTSGAVDVAVDESVAMVILRKYERNDGPFVMEIVINVAIPDTTYESWDLEIEAGTSDKRELSLRLDADFRLRHLDGTAAERLGDLIDSNGTPLAEGEGTFQRSVTLDGGRLVTAVDGTEARLTEISWVEKIRMDGITTTHKAEGKPCLVVEQLDDNGEPQPGRLVVDEHLYAWRINEDGTVVPQGDLD
ncbi:MAG TPA: restriction endonuclease, partial [Solirubrobacterales bacterium]|nr:restriction endonuclease [Solirubrobacterales bacterium]